MTALLDQLPAVLVWMNVRVVLLLVLVWSALLIVDARAGSFRHSVWFTAAAGCLALPLLGAVLPPVSISILPSAVPPASEPAALVIPENVTAVVQGSIDPSRALAFVYALGFVVVLGHFAFSVFRLARLEAGLPVWTHAEVLELKDSLKRELGIDRPVRVLCSDSIDSPYTWGTLLPRIVLPAAAHDWSLEHKRNALLHELAHIRRLDWLRVCMQRLIAAIYWFNPLVWIALRECSFEAERACDEIVLRSGGKSSEYAEQLVDLMISNRDPRRPGIALGDARFCRRIRSILDATREVAVMSRSKTGCVMAANAALVVVLAACQATGQTVEEETLQGADEAAGIAAEQAQIDREQAEIERLESLEQEERRRAEAERERLEREARAERERLEREARADRERVAAEAARFSRTLLEAQEQARRASQEARQAQEQALQMLEQAMQQATRARQQAEQAQQQASQALEQTMRVLEQVRAQAEQQEAQRAGQGDQGEQG